MATYAIGDLQGCFVTLQSLLEKIRFDAGRDRLWFVGDLVNRGPGSLECLRFIKSLADGAVTVLGNHDLHLLALAEGFGKSGKHDTLDAVLTARDRDELLTWLRNQKLLFAEGDFVLVHAGLLPQWPLDLALQLARNVEEKLRGEEYRELLGNMYGNKPDMWSESLQGVDRMRLTINAMTRMRVLAKGVQMDLKFKGEIDDLPADTSPWFAYRHPSFTDKTIIAGHWSALGLHISRNFVGLDSGCIWGQELTAFRLEDRKIFQVPCVEKHIPGGWE